MIFEELALVDVGPFGGEQRLPLAPASAHRPVVLVGGLNGSGKTTILEALLLALYGGQAPSSRRRASSHENYLRQLVHHQAEPAHGARVELAFRAVSDGAWHAFRVIRRWWIANDRVRESLEVTRDGVLDPVLTEGWADYVEALAPRGVANLFFFDGEQIEAFADLEAAKELVRTAIGGLLGLDLLDRLQDDLAILERRKRTEVAAGEEETQSLKVQQASLDKLRRHEADTRHRAERAEQELERAKRRAEEATQRLAAEGGERYKARHELQTRREQALATYRQARSNLIEALGGLAPLLLVEPLIAATVDHARAEQRQADNQTLAHLLEDRDSELLDFLHHHRASASIQQAVASFLADDRARRKAGDGTPSVVGTDPSTLATAQRLLAGDLAEQRHELRKRVDELAAAQAALDDADRALQMVPEPDAIAEAIKAHQEATEALAQAQARFDAARAEHQEAVNWRRAAERRFAQELSAVSETLLRSEDARRVIEHAARSRRTVAQLRAAATRRHLSRIEALILDSAQTLLRKSDLIHEIKIDPETCAVELYTHDGRPVRPRTLSAGERQLLAVSMLAGLARASGRLLPVVIDTPLGRLDRDHRRRLIQRYLPRASHQVIVLSTDTEITPEVLDRLGDSVSHMIKLEHDSRTQATHVTDGYFTLATTGGRERTEQ